MKKILSLFAVMAIIFAGCSESADSAVDKYKENIESVEEFHFVSAGSEGKYEIVYNGPDNFHTTFVEADGTKAYEYIVNGDDYSLYNFYYEDKVFTSDADELLEHAKKDAKETLDDYVKKSASNAKESFGSGYERDSLTEKDGVYYSEGKLDDGGDFKSELRTDGTYFKDSSGEEYYFVELNKDKFPKKD